MSKRFSLNSEDLRKVAKNALIFLAPVLILVLQQIEAGKSLEEIQIVMRLWGINVALDFLIKFVKENK